MTMIGVIPRKTRGALTVTVDDKGHATMTGVPGQTRTVTPYDYRLTDGEDESTGWMAVG